MNTSAAPASAATSRSGFSLPGAGSIVWLYALVGVMAAMHLSMMLGRSVNWDEFWFYSQVEQVARGDFIQPLQTIHTRFFAWWLPAMPGSEVDHIVISRLFMSACMAVTATGIYLFATTFSDKRSALIALAAYLGAGFVLQHGTSFRVDPIVTACLTSGLVIAARTRLTLPSILALGAVIGLAAMVTVKMVLWAPAFAGIALWRWEDHGFDWRYLLRWIAAGLTALAVFALLYALHSAGIGDGTANEAAAGTLSQSADKMLSPFDNPQPAFTGKALMTALPLAILAAMVPWVALKSDWSVARKIALLAMWFPILTPLFYHNSYPYFYVFILPPVAVTSAVAIPIVVRRYGTGIVAGLIAGSALMVWAVDARGVIDRQRVLVEAVHQAFPEPVAYFDCCGMIGSFDKANMFRTSWGIELYLKSGRPLMLETLRNRTVPLMIDNKREFSGANLDSQMRTFHPQDLAAMRATYMKLWGDIYVAGREFEPGEELQWDVLVPGTYKVEGGEIIVAGTTYADGETLELKRGPITLTNPGKSRSRLIWGENTRQPTAALPDFYWTAF